MKRLIAEGYIQRLHRIINPSKLQLEHIAFAEGQLSNTQEEALQKFNAAVKPKSGSEECHMIAGRFDYLLKIRTKDIPQDTVKCWGNDIKSSLCRQHLDKRCDWRTVRENGSGVAARFPPAKEFWRL